MFFHWAGHPSSFGSLNIIVFHLSSNSLAAMAGLLSRMCTLIITLCVCISMYRRIVHVHMHDRQLGIIWSKFKRAPWQSWSTRAWSSIVSPYRTVSDFWRKWVVKDSLTLGACVACAQVTVLSLCVSVCLLPRYPQYALFASVSKMGHCRAIYGILHICNVWI